jgi:predicted ATPase/predicted negative regulator of RcsB-dependent stress response
VASSFVGRAADIAGVARLFEAGARLVTITGPGGMGKTRVAIRYAEAQVAALSAHGGGGAWICDLTEARSAMDIAAAVAAALGAELRERMGEAAAVEELGRAMARRGRLLVVLDNFEHLAREAPIVGAWTAIAGEARFLCTSRVALDLPGEALWPLDALPRDDAVALFLARARDVRPNLDAGAGDREVLAEIVQRLDGMPLALELAASRMAVLSPPELRDRLRRPLDLLVRRRDETRHASVRRAVLDSVQLLGDAERAAFAACAVFRGGFGLDAAEAVLGDGALARLEALAKGSLLRAVPAEDLGGALRFSFFETIREVAQERFAEDPERAAIERRHAAFYADLGRRLGPEAAIRTGTAIGILGRELENMVEAHARAAAAGDAATAITLALGLDPLLSVRGQSSLRRRLLDTAIALARAAAGVVGDGTLAEALLARALACRELGEVDAARADLDAGLALAEAAGRPALAALAHLRVGEIVEVAGATAEARERFSRALTVLARAPQDPARTVLEAETHLRMGHAHRREGALDQAEASVGEAAARYRLLGHDEGLAGVLYEGAVVAMFQGRAEVALARYDEGLAVARRVGAGNVGAALTTARGSLLQELGRPEEARASHAEAARVFHDLGSRYREMSALYYLATAYVDTGEPAEAEKILARALDRGRGVGAPRYEVLIEGCRAVALAMLGDRAASDAALAAADRAMTACGSEQALAATLAVHRLTLSLPEASPARRAEAEASARAIVAAHPSDDSRFALRTLLAALRPEALPTPSALVVLEDARGFRLPHASAPVDLSRRAPLRGILALLARRRRDAPGEAVPLPAIIDAGWPGEKIQAEAAINRVHVALTTLRKLGLRELLVTADGGYMLDPAVAMVLAADAAAR